MRKLAALAALLVVAIACEKTEDPNSQNSTAPTPSITVKGVDAVLAAINTSSTTEVPVIGTTTIVIGTASANFFDGKGGSSRQNAGKVECISEELKNSDNSYFYQPSQTNPSGLSFGASVGWKVAGNGNVPAINEVYNKEVPQIGALTGAGSEVSRGSALTLGFNANDLYTDISSADSILFNVIDKNGKILSQTKGKSATSATFTASELGSLAEGFAFLQVAAYNYQIKDYSGYKVAYINQGANTKSVTLK